jgi:hypothetical protein
VATWVTGRYGVGTLDRVPLGPVVIGGPLGETPQPPARWYRATTRQVLRALRLSGDR